MNYLNRLFLVPRWFGWVAFDDVASSLACQGGPHNLSTPLLLCGKQVWRLHRRGRDRATCRRKEAGVACPCSWTLARATERRGRKEAPPLPLSAQVGSPHARAGTLLPPLGHALEVAVGEAPLVVQRNRCPDWPPRGERGKGVGEAWPPPHRPLGVPPLPEGGRRAVGGRSGREADGPRSRRTTTFFRQGRRHWVGGSERRLLNVMCGSVGEERLWGPPLTCVARCHAIENHHQNH
jgi:hypothetical protein